jgi:hypothetical protein
MLRYIKPPCICEMISPLFPVQELDTMAYMGHWIQVSSPRVSCVLGELWRNAPCGDARTDACSRSLGVLVIDRQVHV